MQRALFVGVGLVISVAGFLPMGSADNVLPEEGRYCNNGMRVRACNHPSVRDSPANGLNSAECGFRIYGDFVFDDPLFATPWAGDFWWSWGDSQGHSASGDFSGVPLYPSLGLVIGPGFNIDVESGETYKAWAYAGDRRPIALEDEAIAVWIFICP